jgi:hypothetical protein
VLTATELTIMILGGVTGVVVLAVVLFSVFVGGVSDRELDTQRIRLDPDHAPRARAQILPPPKARR